MSIKQAHTRALPPHTHTVVTGEMKMYIKSHVGQTVHCVYRTCVIYTHCVQEKELLYHLLTLKFITVVNLNNDINVTRGRVCTAGVGTTKNFEPLFRSVHIIRKCIRKNTRAPFY